MDSFNVLLDTNVFIRAKFGFNTSSLQSLRKYCNDGIACLYTNDIIVREVNNHIKKEIQVSAQNAKNAIKDRRELINAITDEEFERIQAVLLDAPEKLIASFESYIENAVVLSNDALSVIDLFDDYFSSQPPFEGKKSKKSEFPDAAIIMSIKHFLSANENIYLHIVSDDDGWHNALADTPNAVLYRDLNALLTAISKEQILYDQIVSFIGEQTASLEEKVRSWLYDQEWDFAVDEDELFVECDEVNDIDADDISLILDAIEYIDHDEQTAVASLLGTAEVAVHFSYIDHSKEVYDKEDHIWYNTCYGDGTVVISIPISFSITVLFHGEDERDFELDSPDFDTLDRRSASIIDYNLVERIDYNICPDCGQRLGLHNDGGNGFCINCAPNH